MIATLVIRYRRISIPSCPRVAIKRRTATTIADPVSSTERTSKSGLTIAMMATVEEVGNSFTRSARAAMLDPRQAALRLSLTAFT